MKKLVCAIVLLLAMTAAAGAVSARGAIVMDGLTGAVYFEQNADERLPMASTTKIMTALVAIEEGGLDREYEVRREYTLVEGSSMYLREGEKITLRETLYGLMLMSGNDAALAVAGECGGLETFVAKMNAKARALGLTDTHFDNPNGLDSETHYTTARELAALTAYAMKNETFREIVSTSSHTAGGRSMTNHNKLLRQYEGAVGVKTGFTKKDGRCLVSAAERNGRRLIAVTLNDPDDWRDHAAMLDLGFSKFTERALQTAGETVAEIPVYGGAPQTVPLTADGTVTAYLAEGEKPALTLTGPRFVYAPVFGGARYGTAEYRLGGQTLGVGTVSFGGDAARQSEKKSLLERLFERVFG